MSTEVNKTAAAETPAAESTAPKAKTAKAAGPKAEAARQTITIRLPRARTGEEDTVFVGVNGKAWRIRRGCTVEVPISVAEVIRNSMNAEERAELYKATLN